MSDIFLSYTRDDEDRAAGLAGALEALGWSVWWDRSIPAGKTFDEVIEEAIDASRCVVVMWSALSVKSRWVRTEAEEGAHRGILVPVRIDDVRIPLAFRRIQAADLIGWNGSAESPAFLKLAADIESVLGPPPAGEEARRKAEEEREAEASRQQAELKRKHDEARRVREEAERRDKEKAGRKAEADGKVEEEKGKERGGEEEIRSNDEEPNRSTTQGRRANRPTLLTLIVVSVPIVLIVSVLLTRMERNDHAVSTPSEEQRGQPESFKDCEFCPEMVRVPAGEFEMGDLQGGGNSDERPIRTVRFAKPFAIGRYEVTFAEFDRFAKGKGIDPPNDRGWGRGNRPVVNVSWEAAKKYATWLSEQTGKRYRLPTEAEWEYAARAGTRTAYWWGNDVGRNRANCDGCGSRWDDKQTAPVGSFPANPFGLSDTAGNVWEWVQDCWHENYQGAPEDGSKPWGEEDGGVCQRRVLRGCSWSYGPGFLRSAYRWFYPGFWDNYWGFRLAQDL
ncbi:MAG: SUMF1/EgtB/PvdO family nonheme iron enzyme [Gammaproteobacteria bacterium]|nr:SUMF1/EgtB/PvdO family nonheme iron enzyme [Gammaproteobacteria bacterium]